MTMNNYYSKLIFILLGGGQVPRVTWQQVGFNDVQITWFPPLNTDPPKKGYRVILNGRNHSQTLSPIMATSLNFTVPRTGNYMFSVIPISDHYPAKELEVTVPFKGKELAFAFSIINPASQANG